MSPKLHGSGMITPGGSAEKIIPSLYSIGEHYCGIVSQLGKAAELFKRQKDQLAVSETKRNVSVKEVNKLKLQATTAKSAVTVAFSKLKEEHEAELNRLRKEKTDDSLKRKAVGEQLDGYRRDIVALEKKLQDTEAARKKADQDPEKIASDYQKVVTRADRLRAAENKTLADRV